VLLVRQRQPIEAEGFVNILFHPLAELRIFLPPALKPLRQVFLYFGQILAVIESQQFLPAMHRTFPEGCLFTHGQDVGTMG
jgi:hypothetical protein